LKPGFNSVSIVHVQ